MTRIRASGKAKGPKKKKFPNAWPIDRMCPKGVKPSKGKDGQERARMGKDGKSWVYRGEVCPTGSGTDMSWTPHSWFLAAHVTNLEAKVG